MLEGALGGLSILLAATGLLALLTRLGRTLLRLALHAAELAMATEMAEHSARRGDLTGMSERRLVIRDARRRRLRDRLLAAALLLWVAIPPFTEWTREIFALAAPLWLLPSPRVRPRQEGAEVVEREGR